SASYPVHDHANEIMLKAVQSQDQCSNCLNKIEMKELYRKLDELLQEYAVLKKSVEKAQKEIILTLIIFMSAIVFCGLAVIIGNYVVNSIKRAPCSDHNKIMDEQTKELCVLKNDDN